MGLVQLTTFLENSFGTEVAQEHTTLVTYRYSSIKMLIEAYPVLEEQSIKNRIKLSNIFSVWR